MATVEDKVHELQWGPLEDNCFVTNSSNFHGAFSGNTCGYASTDLLGIDGSDFWVQDESRDALDLFTQFHIKLDDINGMMLDMSRRKKDLTDEEIHHGKGHFDAACAWIKNNTAIWVPWLPYHQYEGVQVIVISETEEESNLELWLSMIAVVVVLGILIMYMAGRGGVIQTLQDVGGELLDIAAGALFTVVFSLLDLATDCLNFFYVVNPHKNVNDSLRLLFIASMSLSACVILYLIFWSWGKLTKIFHCANIGKHKQRKRMSIWKHEKFKKELKRDDIMIEFALLTLEDIPMLALNIYFTFVLANEDSLELFQVLAIISGSFTIGMNVNTMIMTRSYRQGKEEFKKKLQMAQLSKDNVSTAQTIRDELGLKDILDWDFHIMGLDEEGQEGTHWQHSDTENSLTSSVRIVR